MPSPLHEALVTLFRERPSLAPSLLARSAAIEVPDDDRIHVTSAEFAEMAPAEYRADIVLRIDDESGAVEGIFIIEVQLDVDDSKGFSWPQYVAGARVRFRCPATLLVVALEPRVARWARRAITLDIVNNMYCPAVITAEMIPRLTDMD